MNESEMVIDTECNVTPSGSGTKEEDEVKKPPVLDNILDKTSPEMMDLVKQYAAYAKYLEKKVTKLESEAEKHEEYKLRCVYREKVLTKRLYSREQQIQQQAIQLKQLRSSQYPSTRSLKNACIDPAVSILICKLKEELTTMRANLEETQNELNAWKFTPDSNTGKRLMAKCRLLHQENGELGKIISSGRVAKLEGELALQKSFCEEVKKSQNEMDEFLQELDEDVEGMQGTIYHLQQELKKYVELTTKLQEENKQIRESLHLSLKEPQHNSGPSQQILETSENTCKETKKQNAFESSPDQVSSSVDISVDQKEQNVDSIVDQAEANVETLCDEPCDLSMQRSTRRLQSISGSSAMEATSSRDRKRKRDAEEDKPKTNMK